MSRGLNKVLLIGNLGGDPVVKATTAGTMMGTVSLATSKGWQDKQTGETKTLTEWHKIVFFGKLAEIAGQYLRKGSKTHIEGSLRARKWTDNTGVERYTTEIIADEMVMLDKAPTSISPYRGINETMQEPTARAGLSLSPASAPPLFDSVASRTTTASTPLSMSPTNVTSDGAGETLSDDDIPF
jgi:single-strand DNA-binding protein